MAKIKQVLVIRKDLNMRKGKMIAQGAHASLSAYTLASYNNKDQWLSTGQTKICVGVESESELLELYEKLKKTDDLAWTLIQDEGRTEFKEPTYTAIAIGPADAEEIDKLTGHLKLL